MINNAVTEVFGSSRGHAVRGEGDRLNSVCFNPGKYR